MIKKLVTVIVAALTVLCTAGGALAAFEDLQLIRIYYDRNGSEYATTLGNVRDAIAARGTTGGTFGSLTTGFAVYFALDRANNDLWATGAVGVASTINGGPTGLNGINNGTNAMYTQYNNNILGGTNYTGLASATNSFKNKLSATQGTLASAITTTTRLNTEASIAGLLGAGSGSVTQVLYHWSNALTTVASEKAGEPVATITTYFDGSTVISAPPAPTYNVTYNGNTNSGGLAPTDSNSPYSSGSTVTVSGAGSLSKSGYTFNGWNTAADGSGTGYAAGATFPITAHTVLYAQWIASSYTVTYHGNNSSGGAAPTDPGTYTTGSTVTVSDAGTLERTGYSFAGWNTAADGSGTSYTAGATFAIAANTALYAQWSANSYAVSYDGNDNTGGAAPTDPNSPYTHGAAVEVLGNGTLERTGHSFAGWNTAADGSGTSYAAGATFTIVADAALYAQWSANSYTVSYDGNNNTGGSVPSQTYAYGATVTVPGAGALTRTGHTFNGWNTAADGSGTGYAAGGTFTIAAATTLYAQWTTNSYTVTYNGNNNTGGSAPSQTYAFGATVSVSEAGTLARTGHTFNGWNTAADGSGTSYAPGATFTMAGDVALYARWTINSYTLTYNGNNSTGGSAPSNSTDTFGATVTVPGAGTLARTGYTFSGWNTAADGSGTSYAPGATFTMAADTTLFAQWATKAYTVLPSVGIGAGLGGITPAAPQNVEHGGIATFTVTPDPTYTATVTGTCVGTFDGTTFTTDPVTEDCTVVANFSQNNHTVTATAGPDGSVSPASKSVAEGATASLTLTPATGYDIASVTGTCGGTLSGRTFTTAAVTADCTVNATFVIQTRTVTATVTGGNGSITPVTGTVDYGGSLTLAVSPAANHHLATLTDNGVNVTSSVVNGSYTISGVTVDHSVIATFTIDTRTVTATVTGGSGTVTPATSTVNHGGSATVAVAPATGYRLVSLTDNGIDVTSQVFGGSYAIATVTAGHNLVATFAIETKTVTASVVGGNGTVTPETGTVNYGGSAVLTITPAANHHLATLTDNGADVIGSVVNGAYTITGIAADRNVVATFAIDTMSITATVSGGNGAVTPAGSTVSYGSSATLTITPGTGHHLASLTDNGTNVTDAVSNGSYTVAGVTGNRNIAATFAPDIKTVTATVSGSGGNVTPGSSQIAYGGSAVIAIIPATGYRLTALTDNGVNVTTQVSNGSYSVTGVTADRNIVATFALQTRAVTASVPGGNGTVTPASGSVDYGSDALLSITPAANHHLATLTDNGVNVTSSVVNGSYAISGVTVDHNVVATFAIDTRTVIATVSGSNGSITPSGSVVGYGGNVTLAVTPKTGYHLERLTDNGVDVTASVAGGGYTISGVTDNHAVVASFRGITFTVTPSAGANGAISPAAVQTVDAGQKFGFTIAPESGYQIGSVTGCGGTLNGSTYTTSGMTANCSVSATFVPVPALKGDLDRNGELNIADALLALQFAVGLKVQSAADLAAGDVAPIVNGAPAPDRKLDIADAVALLRRSVGQLTW